MGDESTGFYPETIDQSYRIESSNLSRTPSSDGNRRTFTVSVWVKRSALGYSDIFSTGSNSYNQLSWTLRFNTDDTLYVYASLAGISNDVVIVSKALFRDTTNWYHFVCAYDSTQATASNRVKLYANGSQLEIDTGATNHSYGNQNYDTSTNDASYVQRIGRFASADSNQFSGYFAEFNFIDGTALDPTSFGETKNGVWIPKEITGLTYGTNGFRLTFADSSSLGDDTSGNGNDYSSSGLASTDVVPDSPTNNFPTFNPLFKTGTGIIAWINNSVTLSEGNLRANLNTGNETQSGAFATFTVPTSGKWYWEMLCIAEASGSIAATGVIEALTGTYIRNASNTTGRTFGAGDIINIAFDADNNRIFFGINGTFPADQTPTDSSDGTAATGSDYLPYVWGNHSGSANQFAANFGQDSSFAGEKSSGSDEASDANGIGDFYDTPPSGYLALCLSNLPDTTISPNKSTQATDHMGSAIWSGNDTARKISLGFQADWVWTKMRSHSNAHYAFDSVRGDDTGLYPNLTQQEGTSSGSVSFGDSDGFDLGTNAQVNGSGYTFVGWSWKAGGEPTADNSAGAGNTPTANSVKIDGSNLGSALAGTIPATRLSANTTAGFSIVTYTGTGTQSDTVAHGLGAKPKMVFVKSRSEAQNWHVYHEKLDASAPENYILPLNASNTKSSSSADFWNSTAPTTTVMSVGDDNSSNKLNTTYVMYLFAEIEGYSKFGSYTGNSSSDGAFVYTGFRPSFLLGRKITGADNWFIYDNARDPDNVVQNYLMVIANAEASDDGVDFLSNGFKWRINSGMRNTTGQTYIYMAFAEQPFKFSNAR